MTGIDDLIICPRCLKPMGKEVDTMVCQYCGYNEKEERFEIFPQKVAKDGTLIIIQKGLKLYNISDVVELLNALHEENQAYKKKIDIMADAFAQSNDLIEVEQIFYTKVYEPSEYYDEETLSEITNALLGSDGE